MKILIIQENGRHSQNQNFRECHNFKRSFDRIGVESTVWGLGHENFSEPFEKFYEESDVIFIIENYEVNGWIPDISKSNKFKVFWSIDSHCNPAGNQHTANKHKVDLVLNSIESDQSLFNGFNTKYFPNAYPSDLIKPIGDINKEHFLGFCGTPFPERESIINSIENDLTLNVKKDFWVLGDDMVNSINSYKIHLNKTIKNDINYRVFETLGCGTCLLTNDVENINTFFTDMVDIVTYSNYNELIDKINFLNKNQHVIDEISKKGLENVLNNHTYDNRAKLFVDIINGIK